MMEVIFSVFILSVGLVAVIGLIVSSIKNSMDSRNHIIASQLAQEGVELIRNIRDNNWASGAPGGSFDRLNQNSFCRIDYNDDPLTWSTVDNNYCSLGNTSDPYVLSYVGNYYQWENLSANKTKFTRRIAVIDTDPGPDDAERLIYSIVSWDGDYKTVSPGPCNTSNKCVYAEAKLTKWSE